MKKTLPLALILGALVLGALALRARRTAGEVDPGTHGARPEATLAPLVLERRAVPDPVAAASRELDPELARWVRLNDEAVRVLGEGELERAVELFERCLEAHPERDVFRRNLAEALVRLARQRHEAGELAGAIEALARAVELAPGREDADRLEALLARWRTQDELEGEHWTEGSDLFELSYDAQREDILYDSQRVLDHLERAYEDLRQWFGVDPVRENGRRRVRVVLLDPRSFDRLTGLGDWADGVFDGVVRVSVADLQGEQARWRRVLTHELVHAYVVEVGGTAVPGWLNEGLAQLLERPGPVNEVALEAARRRIGEAEPFPLELLQGSLAAWQDPEAIGRAYAQSLLLVEHIARDYGDEALRRMVAGCAEGRPPAESFEAWTSVPLDFVLEGLFR